MIELSIPQSDENTKSAKDLVFSILVLQHPLTAIQIYRIIKKDYNVGLTYVAVKKAINSLVEKNVLEKDQRLYRINKNWLFEVKSTIDKLITAYESGNRPNIPIAEAIKDEYAVYTFTNLLDLDNFWDDLLIHLSNKIKDKESKQYFAYIHYALFLLVNLGNETKLFRHLLKNEFTCNILFIGKSPINRWAKKIYTDLGVDFRLIDNKQSFDNSIAFNIIGETVIQVKYSKYLIAKFEELYKRYKTLEEIPSKEIARLAHERVEIKLNVFKNPEIAKGMMERYRMFF